MEETQSLLNLRKFLISLPTTLNCEYNEPVSYLVWKVLSECLDSKQNGRDIDWDYYSKLLGSKNWINGKYSSVLTKNDWKTTTETPTENYHIGTCCMNFNYPNKVVYYCLTCTLNPIYEICEACFDESLHVGHRFTKRVVTRPEGKICHCGNYRVFKKPEYAYYCKNKMNNTQKTTKDKAQYNKYLVAVFNEILDFMINVTIDHKNSLNNDTYSKGKEKINSKSPANRDNKENSREKANYNTKVRYNVEDYIKGIDCENTVTDTESTKRANQNNSKRELWSLQLDQESCNMTYADLARKLSSLLRKPIKYAISIANELGIGKKSVTLLVSDDLNKLLELQDNFRSQNLNLDLKKSVDIFKLDLMEDLNHYLYNLLKSRKTDHDLINAYRLSLIGAFNQYSLSINDDISNLTLDTSGIKLLGGFLVSNSDKNSHFANWNFKFENDLEVTNIMWIYDMRLANSQSIAGAIGRKVLHGSRFQHLLTNCTRLFSKVERSHLLKNISFALSTIDHIRTCLCAQYIDIYLTLTYHLVSADSTGFTLNLMTLLSQYTYQDPEMANMILRSGFINRTLRYIYMIMDFNPEDLLENLPVVLPKEIRLPKDSLKNNKIIYFFKDLCILLQINTIGRELLEDETSVKTIFDCISQFNNILPLKRETSQHVQYENFDYSSFYFIYLAISMLAENFIRSFTSITDIEVRQKLIKNFTTLVMDMELKNLYDSRKMILSPSPVTYSNGNIMEKLSSILIKENICGHYSDVINFKVGVDTQHFLNPMSYLFKFIIQWSICGRYTELEPHIKESINLGELFADKQKCLYISESALCTMVLVGQINVGFWVRNGAPILHQMKIYTKNNLREFTYFSDLFNIQFSMCYADASDFMVTYLMRWGLKNWSNGIPIGDYPEYETTVQIVYQSTLLLIQLLTDVRALIMSSSMDGFDKTMKNEIIHAVCFQPCTYNDILNSIADYITKHPSFDLYLKEFTTYSPPSGLHDEGIFTLKEEYIADVDPYYIGLAQGKRYEAEKLKSLNTSNDGNNDYKSTFIAAKNVSHLLKGSQFSNLYAITSTNVFGMFLKNTLDYIIKNKHEHLLQVIIHLIHVCVVNNIEAFMRIFWREYAIVNPESCHYHSIGSNLYYFLSQEFFSNSQGEIREIFRYISKAAPHINIYGYLQEQTPSFKEEILWKLDKGNVATMSEKAKKKERAKLRQKKLLKRLAKQQKKFIENNESVESSKTESKNTLIEDSSGYRWEYPDDTCVFCKMDKEEDILVYLCYQEENIHNIGINFANKQGVNELFTAGKQDKTNGSHNKVGLPSISIAQLGAVLRTCSHASHVTCLGNHMKIICSSHNQTTRNIPSSFGFGLLNCPLCNSLCNSFIPMTWSSNNRNHEEFLEGKFNGLIKNLPNLSSGLIFTSIKSAHLLLDLCNYSSGELSLTDMIDTLIVNNTSNLELTIRHKVFNNQNYNLRGIINDQKLLALHLLADLKLAILKGNQYSISENFTIHDRKDFSKRNIDDDLLIYGAKLCSGTVRLYNSDHSNQIKELLKRQLHKEFLTLTREILLSNVIIEDLTNLSFIPINSAYDTGSNYMKEVDITIKIFKEYVTLCHPSVLSQELTKFDKINFHIHHIIINSLALFLRRLAIIFMAFFSTWNIDYKGVIDCGDYKAREIDILLSQFKLNKLETFLSRYCFHDMADFIDLSQEYLLGNNILKIENHGEKVNNIDKGDNYNLITKMNSSKKINIFTSFIPPNLITLPYCLSDYPTNEEEELLHHALNEELGFCLFCGTKVIIQKLSSLHEYQIGECTNHLKNECKINSVYGAFILIKSNTIYISYGLRGSFLPAPYLNEHGEPNKDVKNDTLVYFDKNRYLYLLNEVILGNTIPHIIFRFSSGNSDIGGWESM
ncbi:hypothetical protein TPHA_0N00600 [Tetrapisispora phaffii CBS 4417]|uniref:E3 ubiquitin-protein ligase n=1 Tax=Tetrapisispora phaffii (strain ATCC 24235 / CBS 4417 / NBRC 1672 / NRRL Y-8282 / UCD 70-5) TaxID=1071381 RepID=G8C113_TETPH|nr:hypothetical protein TPHA_0N00600 [Tetrapisispora phaffii CBS 4417]CCE65841.1 hypothetical protein TPHA_0N00600 [Tetrapisispora phaffii CBS 4417]